MKSLQFKKLNISDSDVLTRLQMKKVTGGHGMGLYKVVCNDCTEAFITSCYSAPAICDCHQGEFSCEWVD